MVINVGMLRSGRSREVEGDIRAVVEAAAGTPVKVILEAHHLTDEQIVEGEPSCRWCRCCFCEDRHWMGPYGRDAS